MFQLAAFAALEGLFQIIHGRGNRLRGAPAIAIGAATGTDDGNSRRAALILVLRASASRPDRACVAASDDLHQVKIASRVFLEALHHGFEHVERLALVLDQRILLPIATKTDSLFEVVHIEQVVFPLLVEDAQHDHALVIAHGFGTD